MILGIPHSRSPELLSDQVHLFPYRRPYQVPRTYRVPPCPMVIVYVVPRPTAVVTALAEIRHIEHVLRVQGTHTGISIGYGYLVRGRRGVLEQRFEGKCFAIGLNNRPSVKVSFRYHTNEAPGHGHDSR